MMFNKDEFLSKVFLKSFYHVNDINLKTFLNDKVNLQFNSIYSVSIKTINKILPNYDGSLLNFGFTFVGLLTTYELDLSNYIGNYSSSKNIRLTKKLDIKELKRIAYDSFQDDKFHHDVRLSKSLADEYYATWIENSCNGLTDLVWVYEVNSVIQGFMSVNYPNNEKDYCQIILNAIDKLYRNQGKYFELLVHTIEDLIKKGYRKLRIGTYENSIGVHNNLKKLQFKPIYYNYIYHYHS